MASDIVTLAAPLASFERMKRALAILVYVVMAELADPRPFHTSWVARVLFVALVFELGRQFLQYRLEVSHGAVVQRRALRARWERGKGRIDPDTRYKLRRMVIILAGFAAFGFLLDALTPRCTGALQCSILFPRLALEGLPMALQVFLMIAMGMSQLMVMMWALTKVGFVKIIPPGTVTDTFADVWGQDDARDKVMEQVALLNDDVAIASAGGFMPKGVLLHGPPGTGKTLLAKAAANASTKPLILVPPGAFASTFVGINYLKVYMLFRYMRKFSMRHDGVIVFFDEIDSLGHRGGEVSGSTPAPQGMPPPCASLPAEVEPSPMMMMGSQDSGTLTAFLAAMDGMQEPRGLLNKALGIFGFKPLPPPVYRYLMLAATNRPTAIDPALLRAGRLGRKILVDYPKYEGRVKTYEGYLAGVDSHLTEEQVAWMARNHYHGTGADIKDIVNEAVLISFRGDREGDGITFKDLTNAMLYKKHGESAGVFEVQRHVRSVAVHEAGHALAFHYLLRDRVQIWFASIEQHGKMGGMVSPSPIDEDWLLTKEELFARIQVSLASRAAETLLLGTATNGHTGDGMSATTAAAHYIDFGHWKTIGFGGEDDATKYTEHVEEVLELALKHAWKMLGARLPQLDLVARLLEREHTVSGDKIHHLLDWYDERYPT